MSIIAKIKYRVKRQLARIINSKKSVLHTKVEEIFNFPKTKEQLTFIPLTVNDVINKLNQKKTFFYTKINHGFWETLVLLHQELTKDPALTAEEFERRYSKKSFCKDGFSFELLSLLQKPINEDTYYAASYQAFTNSDQYVLLPRFSTNEPLVNLIHKYSPANQDKFYDGTLWKDAVFTDELLCFFHSLESQRVVIVGPQHLEKIGNTFNFKHFDIIPIHPTEARDDRKKTERLIKQKHSESNEYTVFLVQAGTIAPYWILRLANELRNVAMIDLGMALDVVAPEVLMKTNFGKLFHEELAHRYQSIAPTWEQYSNSNQKHFQHVCKLQGITAQTTFDIKKQKTILEQWLAHDMQLANGRTISAFTSNQQAWKALLNLKNTSSDKPLRWVASASSTLSTLGLVNVTFVDCDQQGLLSLDELAKINSNVYNGIIVTNPYGLANDFTAYISFCKKHKKQLLLDNSFRSATREPNIDEVFNIGNAAFALSSQHITDDESGQNAHYQQALEALYQLPSNAFAQVMQYERSVRFTRELDLKLLFPFQPYMRNLLPNHAPLVSSVPTNNNNEEYLQSYYQPASDEFKMANYLYRHCVCLSTSKEMQQIANDEITSKLRKLLQQEMQ